MLRNSKTITAIIVILLVLGVGYYLSSRPAADMGFDMSLESSNLALQSEKILADIHTLNRITIDGSIFSDATFMSLVDRRVPLTETPTGRPNPFAPVQ